MQITDEHFDRLIEDGYVILHNYYSGARLRELAAAQRRLLKTWDEIKDNPPPGRCMYVPHFPCAEQILNRAILDPQLLALARRFLKTEQVHYRAGTMVARYPGFADGGVHIDNGNNSLLPMSETAREYARIGFWTHLEDVGEDQAPLLLIPKKHGQDASKAEPLVCEGGTVAVFHTYTWHSASSYRRADGQRFTWGFGFGRADHPWEGFKHYTHAGMEPHFREFIGSLAARERELFRFPPAGHPYYTAQTLAALEEQYPGWNARGEYESGA